MNKLNKILIAIVVILILVLGAVLYWQETTTGNPYYAVYLNTGDIYFGKLNTFPSYSLSDVYYIQRNANDTKNPLSISKFSSVFWGPENVIYLNRQDVVWTAKLSADSQVLKYIESQTNK